MNDILPMTIATWIIKYKVKYKGQHQNNRNSTLPRYYYLFVYMNLWIYIYIYNIHTYICVCVFMWCVARFDTRSNTFPWLLFTFSQLYKWYQIAQNITYVCGRHNKLSLFYKYFSYGNNLWKRFDKCCLKTPTKETLIQRAFRLIHHLHLLQHFKNQNHTLLRKI